MRKLVTLRTIDNIIPIANADNIALAIIDGWQCVVKKGEFNIGDVGIYFEVDSLIPLSDPFNFLKDKAQTNHGGVDFNIPRIRIKTMRLRGQLSQGLLLPLRLFPDIDFTQYNHESDLTEVVDVIKYEPKVLAQLRGRAKGLFPTWIFKSDQERVNNLPDVQQMSEEQGLDYEVTLKMNGCSMTVFYQTVYDINNDNGICSRNYQLELDQENNHYCDLQKRDHIIERLIEYHAKTGKSYAVQGELVGVDIQKNYERFDTLQFFVFDVFDIQERKYLLPIERRKVVAELGLKHVPVIEESFSLSNFSKDDFMHEILKYAEGSSIHNPVREGVVFKSNQSYQGRPYTFKAISNVYLEKHDTD